METLTLAVDGMFCGHCEAAIQDAVRKLPGIKKVKASKRKKQVLVEYDGGLTSPEHIREAIAATGYEIVG